MYGFDGHRSLIDRKGNSNNELKDNKMKLDFDKMGGLLPAIIQDADTGKVLMLGFMNEQAYQTTQETGKVTFFSRTRNCLWTRSA